MAALVPGTDNVGITALLPEHARAVVELHISGIATGFTTKKDFGRKY
jgi:hypothetical protein